MKISPTIDHNLMLLLNCDLGEFADNMMVIASSKLFTLPLVLYALYIIYKRYGIKNMFISIIIIVAMVTFADQVSQFFKYNVSRLRPTHTPSLSDSLHTVGGYLGGLYGTVSAHAANSVAILGFCLTFVDKKWYRLLCIAIILTICYSRIYLGVHFPLDIWWGILLGVVTASFGVVSYKKITIKKL